MKALTIAVILSLAGSAHAAEFMDLAVKASDLKAQAAAGIFAVRPERAARPNVTTIYFCGTAITEVSAGLQNEPRVVYKFEGGLIRTMPLNEAVTGRETPEQIAGKLAEFGGLN